MITGYRQGLASLLLRFNSKGYGGSLVRGATGSFVIIIMGTGIAFLVQMVLARLMGAAEYGVYIYSLTIVQMLLLPTAFGLDSALIRFLPQYRAEGSWSLLRGIIKKTNRLIFFNSILIGGLASIVVALLSDRIDPGLQATLWLAFLMLPMMGFVQLRQAQLIANKQVVYARIPDAIVKPILIVSFAVGVYLYLGRHMDSQNAMLVNMLATLWSLLLISYWSQKTRTRPEMGAEPEYETRKWIRVAFPMLLISSMSMLLYRIDIVMIGILTGAERAGVYAVSSRFAELVTFGLAAINLISAPLISELYARDNKSELQRIVVLAAQGAFLFTLFAGLVLLLFGEHLLGLFGDEFRSGYIALLVIVCGRIVTAFTGVSGYIMSMTGHQKNAARIVGASAVINLVLNLLLIPRYGIEGAAIATAISNVLADVSMVVYVRMALGIQSTPIPIGSQ